MGACGSKQDAAAQPKLAVAAQAPQTVVAPTRVQETDAAAVSLPDVHKAEIIRLKADIMYLEYRMKDLSAEKANELKTKVTEMHANMARLEDYLANQDERAFNLDFVTDIIHDIRDNINGVLGDIEEAIGNATGAAEAKIEEFTTWTSSEITKLEEKVNELAENVVDKINGYVSSVSCGMGMLNCCQDTAVRSRANKPRPKPSPRKPTCFEYFCECQGCRCCINPDGPFLDEHEIQMGSEADRPGPPSPRKPSCFEYLCECQGSRCCINPDGPSLDEHEIHMGRQANKPRPGPPRKPTWFEYLCECQGCRCCINPDGPFLDEHEILTGGEEAKKARGIPDCPWFHCPCECDECECTGTPDKLEINLGKQVDHVEKARSHDVLKAKKARGKPDCPWFHCPCECDECECTGTPDKLEINLGKQVDHVEKA